jgi:hypothetical protein
MQRGTGLRKALAMLLLLGLCLFFGHGVFLYAQEEDWEEDPDYDDDGGIPIESDWDDYRPDLYTRGDQTFTISLGVIFPIVFFDYQGSVVDHHFNPPLGGAGSLSYNYFLGPNFFMGVEIGMMFNYTLGQNTVFFVPVGLRAGWQFIFRRFEFPLYITAGFAPQRYLNLGYGGLFIKGGGSVYYRFNPDWSFGVNVDWDWFPQWPFENGKRGSPQRDIYANILTLTLSARYHF